MAHGCFIVIIAVIQSHYCHSICIEKCRYTVAYFNQPSLSYQNTNQCLLLLGRPTQMSANLRFTTDSSFFFIRPVISELAERNSTISGHVV